MEITTEQLNSVNLSDSYTNNNTVVKKEEFKETPRKETAKQAEQVETKETFKQPQEIVSIEENNKAESDEKSLTEKTLEKKETQDNSVNPSPSNTLIRYQFVENENSETGKTTKELVVFLLDKTTGKVLRRIPPEDFTDPNNSEFQSFHRSGNLIDQVG